MAKTLQEIFDDMPTRVVLDWHDEALREPIEEILKAYEDRAMASDLSRQYIAP